MLTILSLMIANLWQMWRGRKIPAGLRNFQAQADQGEMHRIRGRYRQMLPAEVILGTIRHKKLYSQLRTASQFADSRCGRIQQKRV